MVGLFHHKPLPETMVKILSAANVRQRLVPDIMLHTNLLMIAVFLPLRINPVGFLTLVMPVIL